MPGEEHPRPVPPAAVAADALEASDPEVDAAGLERLVFFSDAVFAIAITLLVLDIRLPVDATPLNDAQLAAALRGLWQKFMAYIVSFLVIGTFWVGHHRKFRYIRRYDRRLVWLNLLLLMVVAFIPFPTEVLSENSGRTATIFYAIIMVIAGLISVVTWGYATYHDRLVDPGMPANVRRRETLSRWIMPGVFLLSIGLAFINADLAKYSWILIIPAMIAFKT